MVEQFLFSDHPKVFIAWLVEMTGNKKLYDCGNKIIGYRHVCTNRSQFYISVLTYVWSLYKKKTGVITQVLKQCVMQDLLSWGLLEASLSYHTYLWRDCECPKNTFTAVFYNMSPSSHLHLHKDAQIQIKHEAYYIFEKLINISHK